MLKILPFIMAFIVGWIVSGVYLFWRQKYTRNPCCKLKDEFLYKLDQIIKKSKNHQCKKYSFFQIFQKLKEEENVLVKNYSKLRMQKVCRICLILWKLVEEETKERNFFQ